jgi:hypothetical protein
VVRYQAHLHPETLLATKALGGGAPLLRCPVEAVSGLPVKRICYCSTLPWRSVPPLMEQAYREQMADSHTADTISLHALRTSTHSRHAALISRFSQEAAFHTSQFQTAIARQPFLEVLASSERYGFAFPDNASTSWNPHFPIQLTEV